MSRRRRPERFLPYLLLSPALVLLLGMIYPFGLGLYYSFTSYWLQYPNRFRFVWLDNYVSLVEEPLFARALEFTLGFTLVAVTIQVGLGLAVALFLHARIPGRGALRALMLMPLMMPPVITALMWKIMMASTTAGILNHMLSFIDVGPINWFGSTEGAVASILIIDTWGNLPFVALILLGGLQALPNETLTVDLHCVTKWSKLGTPWRGVRVETLLEDVETAADFVLAHSYGGYTTNMPLEDLLEGQAWIVYEYDGAPVPAEHGGPARLLVPHLYLWKSAKWVRELQLLLQDEPGFWETAGYHNYGDPWREQRYWGD